MKNSIRKSIRILCISMVVIVFITTLLLCSLSNNNHIFSLQNIICLIILIIIADIFSNIVAKMIVNPLKKMEKGMRSVADGKIVEAKQLKEYGNLKEIDDTIEAYRLMMALIKKNNFDLNSQQSKTEIILEHMADGVIAFSISRQVVHMNKAAIRLLNLDSSEDTFEKIVKKLDIQIDFDKLMYLPNYTTYEVKLSVEDNALNIVFIPFFSDKLTPMGVIMMIRNITESVRLDNMRKDFIANISHELKTPLTSIKGYSETMMNGDLTYQEVIKFSKVINQEANRMGRLASDLLQLSRFDSKTVNWKKVQFPLNEMTTKVCEKMKFEAEEKRHTLEFFASDKNPMVYADKDSIEQVIMNILSNSIKYTPDGGNIKVYDGCINERAYIKVIDNGIGIPQKDLGRIYERFYRADKARSRQMGGTGLGLSIVKEIIEGMDGTIDIKSEVNKGTEVVITLPTKAPKKIGG